MFRAVTYVMSHSARTETKEEWQLLIFAEKGSKLNKIFRSADCLGPMMMIMVMVMMMMTMPTTTTIMQKMESYVFFLSVYNHGNKYKRWFNSLLPSDAICQGSRSALVQEMTCCLTAPSHYLNQCWLILTKVQWCSSEGNFAWYLIAITH